MTPLQSEGPALDTSNRYVSIPPTSAGLGLAVLTMERSADGRMGVCAESVLFAKFGSGVMLLATAVLTKRPEAEALSIPRMTIFRRSPACSRPT